MMIHLVQAKLELYVTGQLSLRQLEEWLVVHLQEILSSGDRTVIELANNLDADLVEFSEGLMGEAAVAAHIQEWLSSLDTIRVNIPQASGATTVEAKITSQTVRTSVEVLAPGRVVDLHLAHQWG